MSLAPFSYTAWVLLGKDIKLLYIDEKREVKQAWHDEECLYIKYLHKPQNLTYYAEFYINTGKNCNKFSDSIKLWLQL